MAKSLYFLMGIHCHQPVGNFEHVLEDATKKSYRPFLEVLKRHPGIKLTLHYSGILLEWMERKHPEILDDIQALAASGQVELMTGGFYEPILAVIPDRDKLGQIRKETEWLKRRFNAKASGFWLAERVWEPHLPKILNEAGAEYLAVDDSHFKAAGLDGEALTGRYVTEEQGKTLEIFPSLERLRYLIPFRQVHESIDYLRTLATEEGNRCAVTADDGEKFGNWPDTYNWVYEQGWLEKFFILLEENADTIKTATFSEYRARTKPFGRIYLPAASYTEMMEWALPAPAILRYEGAVGWLKSQDKFEEYGTFLRGGFWRDFMVKYDEANNMHKKMMRVSEKVAELDEKNPGKAVEAKNELWQGQCNCPYWHGVFGGLYLNHLRFANYSHLIKAEAICDGQMHGDQGYLKVCEEDFNADGFKELLVDSQAAFLGFEPCKGARLFEWDDRKRSVNLGDTMTRRFEAYHTKLTQASHGDGHGAVSIHELVRSKEEGLASRLVVDPYRRVSLLDHFLPLGETRDRFAHARHQELGDFLEAPYESFWKNDPASNGVEIVFQRKGWLSHDNGRAPLKLVKKIRLAGSQGGMKVSYQLSNPGDKALGFLFGVEFNFGLLAGNAPDRYFEFQGARRPGSSFSSVFEEADAKDFSLVDEWLDLKVHFSLGPGAGLWAFPIETVSQSEGGFERSYQNSLLLPFWQLNLAPGQAAACELDVRLEPFSKTGVS